MAVHHYTVLKNVISRGEEKTTTLMSYDEVVKCVLHELELVGISDKKREA